MRAYTRWTLVGFCALAGASSLLAQEDAPEGKPAKEEESRRVGWVFGEFGYWVTQPSGLDYVPATIASATDPFGTTVLTMPQSTTTRPRSRAGYLIKDNIGEVILSYWSNKDVAVRNQYAPGNFVFGEVEAFPFHAGVFDTGIADAFTSEARTGTRDLRLDFFRTAIDTHRVKGRWFVGLRRVAHDRQLVTDYYALIAGLPLVFNPTNNTIQHNLDPIPDHVESASEFSGRGIEAGVELTFPIRGKVWATAGFSLASLRGSISSRYSSTTSRYALTTVSGTRILTAPDDLFDLGSANSSVQQQLLSVGLRTDGASASAQALEGFLEFRWNAWKALEAFAGYRSIRYDNVGADIRPETISISPNGVINVQKFSRTERSVQYEGYYAGVSYKY